MRKVRIGIDIDGVLRDFNGGVMKKAFDEAGLQLSRPTEWNYIDNIKIEGDSLRKKIWEEDGWAKEIFTNSPVLPFAKKGYDAFVNDDQFIVYIVSSQTEETEWMSDEWLEKNGFDGHDDVYYLFNKLTAPAQVLVDDKPSHIEDYLSEGRDGYLMTCSYNLHSSLKPRVENLYEAYELMKERYNKKEAV